METVTPRTTLYDLFPNEIESTLFSNSISKSTPPPQVSGTKKAVNSNYSELLKIGLGVIGIGIIIYLLTRSSTVTSNRDTDEIKEENVHL